MKVKVSLYIISAILIIIGFPLLLALIYLELIDSGLSLKFFWALSLACSILSVLFFVLARLLVAWEEEDIGCEDED